MKSSFREATERKIVIDDVDLRFFHFFVLVSNCFSFIFFCLFVCLLVCCA